ncbi:MAG: ferrochelatase, partial [Halobacteria archaeon]|nr:ferrochelatase [Halobacteria archaeon]
MTTGVALLNFGEPEEPTRDNVVPYLERIFLSNMSLEGEMTEDDARKRAHKLAERRAPGLLEEYDEMGQGSPLIPQAKEQAEMLEDELDARGYDAETYVGMQYTPPFIGDAVEEARGDGVDKIIGLPIYPLCGRTTTIESLEVMEREIDEKEWNVEYQEITGWHEHPTYLDIRADNIAEFVESEGVNLDSDDTKLVFSAHGTPVKYLESGRYDEYVEETCEWVSGRLGVDDYEIGYQNHENRDVEWTQPETEDVIERLGRDDETQNVVVEPLSFMHEQSETLSELDLELRDECDEVGLELYRVPIPHNDPRFGSVLADLV